MTHLHSLKAASSVASLHSARAKTLRTTRAILHDLFGPPSRRSFAVRLWDGSIENPAQPAGFTLVLRRPGAIRRMLLPPTELALGEAYLRDDFDIKGDIEAAAALADGLARRLRSPATIARLMARLLSLPADDYLPPITEDKGRPASRLEGREHSRMRDAAAVRYHYDTGNDFYALWLDSRMVYSCAYFQTGTEDIDAAQTAKLEYICRKLRLQPGERLLDIGCGWGGLVMYAARSYSVQALGVTLSEPQAELARKRIAELGLGERCRIDVRDYRDLAPDPPFDKVVSVGMFEHVGRKMLPTYFAQAYKLTKPGGLFLNHGIVTLDDERVSKGRLPAIISRYLPSSLWKRGAFISKYVFPDGELVTPHEVVTYAEQAGFETRDIESLREHYALTLRRWVHRLEARHDDACRLVGEQTYRVWRLYMAGSAHGFASGKLGVIQTLLSSPGKSGNAHLPLTRADLYRAG